MLPSRTAWWISRTVSRPTPNGKTFGPLELAPRGPSKRCLGWAAFLSLVAWGLGLLAFWAAVVR